MKTEGDSHIAPVPVAFTIGVRVDESRPVSGTGRHAITTGSGHHIMAQDFVCVLFTRGVVNESHSVHVARLVNAHGALRGSCRKRM